MSETKKEAPGAPRGDDGGRGRGEGRNDAPRVVVSGQGVVAAVPYAR